MISPEILNFSAPGHYCSDFSGSGKLTLQKLSSEIKTHHFNHSVTVIIPDTVLVPPKLNLDLTEDNTYYRVEHLSICKFLDQQFIDYFINKGNLSAISIETHIDTDNCAAVTPSGHLVLNLLKETYQSLGLDGTESQFSSERYVVHIDLKNPTFVPGKRNYERAVKCLTEFVNLEMDFLVAWEPPEESPQVCPSSVAAYFATQGCTVTTCTPKVTTSCQYNVKLPSPDTSQHELLEWLGAVALEVNMSLNTSEANYLSSYSGPLDVTQETKVVVLKHFGFFTTTQIEKFFGTYSSYVKDRKELPWAALHVQGFADSPVSWMLREHTYHSDGDNNYTVLLRPDNTLSYFKTCSFTKKMKFKLS